MKYFLKHSYYILIGLFFALILCALIGDFKWELIPIIILNAFLIRLFDDYFDFDKDQKSKKKSELLTKNQLICSIITLSILFLTLNIILFKLWGLLSILLIAYIIIENKYEFLKVLFIPLASIYYIGLFHELTTAPVIFFLIATMICSIGFYIFKSQKRTKKVGKK